MAGDWIKMRGNLWDDPRVARICDLTGSAEAAVIGGLYWLWASADQHSTDGVLEGLSLRAIDRKTGIQGLGDALVSVGWLEDQPDGVRIVRFEEHNGTSAKTRATTAKRVAKHKAANACAVTESIDGNAITVTSPLAVRYLEKEKEKEKSNNQQANACSSADADLSEADKSDENISNCPHLEIIGLYNSILASKGLPAVKPNLWDGQRAQHLRRRWREDEKRQSLDWWRKFFEFVATSDFLMGRKTDFSADLGWLVKHGNFVKVCEGKYRNA